MSGRARLPGEGDGVGVAVEQVTEAGVVAVAEGVEFARAGAGAGAGAAVAGRRDGRERGLRVVGRVVGHDGVLPNPPPPFPAREGGDREGDGMLLILLCRRGEARRPLVRARIVEQMFYWQATEVISWGNAGGMGMHAHMMAARHIRGIEG